MKAVRLVFYDKDCKVGDILESEITDRSTCKASSLELAIARLRKFAKHDFVTFPICNIEIVDYEVGSNVPFTLATIPYHGV